jgi:hypothetical protein
MLKPVPLDLELDSASGSIHTKYNYVEEAKQISQIVKFVSDETGYINPDT